MIQLKKKVAFKTLGCRLNQFETGSLATKFKSAGYELVHFNEKADVYIVNTCTVTNQSDHKSRNTINQALRKGKNQVVVVTGCMAENKNSFLEDDRITYVIGNNNKSDIFSVIEAHYNGEIYELDNQRNVFEFQNPEKIYKTRGTIKIQDGCDNYCTYCIIPFVRGRAISRPLDDIIENARQLINNGYHEIVITGVNIGRYKYENSNFEDVLERILELPGDFRLRISSMEPEGIGEKFLDLVNHPKMCPHLHLCLQSGSDRILIKMRRMYDMKQFMNTIQKIRKIRQDFNFTTDVLVGFPDESEEDFNETVKAVKMINFGHVHTFKYSLRDGTRAARMENQVADKIKNARSLDVRQLSEKMRFERMSKLIGKKQTVLVERKNTMGLLNGYGEHYFPVNFKGDNKMIDTFQQVIISSIDSKNMCLTADLL